MSSRCTSRLLSILVSVRFMVYFLLVVVLWFSLRCENHAIKSRTVVSEEELSV